MNLQTPVKEASRSYKMYATRLEKLGISRIGDFLFHIPFRYEDYSLISKIGSVQAGEKITVKGEVTDIKNEFTRNRKRLQKAKITDDTGEINVIWFNQPFILNSIKKGDMVSLSGKADFFGNKLTLSSPDYEVLFTDETIHTGRLVPIYSETRGISSKWLRRQVYKILSEEKENLNEFIPKEIIEKEGLMDFKKALEQIHFPDSIELAEKSRERLSFDELFLLQLSTLEKRKEWESKGPGIKLEIEKFNKNLEKFLESLPFELTNAQKRAVKEILSDLTGKKPMNRLLEGEVGSGKTVVSAVAMYIAVLNGCQSVIMAPTEILAQQHYLTISKLLSPFKVKVGLVTGSIKQKDEFDVLVGTHAVLSEKIKFKNLALVIIDEQQRFGVEQRTAIREKGKNPHLLTMTATPIPRTVALTIYGDLDLSLLDEMPVGRKRVKTWLVPPEKREGAYAWIEKEIKESKSQAFIICPFIEESESMVTVKAATAEFEKLKDIFPNLNLGMLHGKMKTSEKDKILNSFKDKKIDILIATPVVEVGIDIPNATIIMIEASDRFGLAQLHQLRGRVGRGEKQSYCLLFTESKNEKTLIRLKSMENIFIGAELAELDLKLRGPGELTGTMQHGSGLLKIADFSNFVLIEKTKNDAEKIFSQLSKYPKLLEKISEINVKGASPD